MKILPIVSSLIVLSIALPLQAYAGTPSQFNFHSYEAHYLLRYDGIPFGKSKTLFNIYKNQRYKLCIENKTTLPFINGSVTECSVGIITPTTIKPLQYDYSYFKNSDQEHIHINFNWPHNTAYIITNTSKWHVAIPQNTQDKISYQLLLRRGLAQGQTAFNFPVADGGKLKNYGFTLEKSDNPKLAQLTRTPMTSKENVTLWFQKDLDYLVTKVRQNKHIADIGTAELTALNWLAHA